MYHTGDKYGYYKALKEIFEKNNILVSEYEEINYGVQFHISLNNNKELIRIYQSKKGTRHDLSQIKNEEVLELVEKLINSEGQTNAIEVKGEEQKISRAVSNTNTEELELIGTDESGKGDYFGPLVIAGVYADAHIKTFLNEIGAADSKTLTDSKIEKLAEKIMKNCIYSIVTIGNEKYNRLYSQIRNLNKLLAWGHARAIENILEKKACGYALSDQFGKPDLIKNALMEKGRRINLEQRPRAEENVAVAAASILARNEYVKAMKKMSEEYDMEFPKGASSVVTDKAKEFVGIYGKDKLVNVAKLHFIITKRV
jgi:ribonuclease HIII